MEIKQMLLTPNRFSRPQIRLKSVSKIVVHYVGNAGSTAIANRNYFEKLKSGPHYASSHYIIGLEGEIIQCVPEKEVAYASNNANSYSISIENCHPKADGKFNEKTEDSLVELCADLCKRYNLNPLTDIIRHFDITGKKCPLYWVNYPDDFERFKRRVNEFMKGGDELVDKGKIKVNGKIYEVDRILKGGTNYVAIRDLCNILGVKVGYDAENKVVELEK